MSTKFDRIITSTPLNSNAAKVMAKGKHYEPSGIEAHHVMQDIPLPIISLESLPHHEQREVVRALISKRVGRLLIIGYSGHKSDSNRRGQSQFIVRCDCGNYEHRRGQVLRRHIRDAYEDMCARCSKIKYFRERYQTEGARDIEEFTK